MPAPSYMAERRYSYHVAPSSRTTISSTYEVESPEGIFENDVRDLFLAAQEHLHHEEYGLALAAFEELQLLILDTADPTLPVDPGLFDNIPRDVVLIDVLAQRAGAMLQATPAPEYAFPASLIADSSTLPASVKRKLAPITGRGLVVTSYHDDVLATLGLAAEAAVEERWDAALAHYDAALKRTPLDQSLARGVLLHDMAVLADKADDHARAVALGTDSLELLERSGDLDAQVRALDTMVGVYRRGGEPELAKVSADQASGLRTTHNLDPIVVAGAGAPVAVAQATRPPRATALTAGTAGNGGAADNGATEVVAAQADGAVLVASQFIAAEEPAKSYVVQNTAQRIEIPLADGKGTRSLLDIIAATDDLAVVTEFGASATQMVAYLPHMYFFVIPMAIGDCLVGLGNLEEAEQNYVGTLLYPFINRRYEAVRLWTKLADVYLALGDAAYRAARDKTSAFAAAKAHYEKIVKTDGTLDAGSALYADDSFTGVKTRVQAVLAAPNPARTKENPDLVTRVLGAKAKLDQIAAGLNFFGLAPGYLAPFGWEYLQTTARYFAQAASQIEQRYILFKSTAENEELRAEQLTQQADIAAETVVLEERGLAEAEAGVEVAQASLDYADVQVDNAVQANEDFNDVRSELVQLAGLEAWVASTTVMTEDGTDVSVNISNQYYDAEEKPKNDVLEDLAEQRTEITNELEDERLDRAIEAAEAAKDMAEAQLEQAEARVSVSEQRLELAQLQQTYAEENRDFLDAREFTARLWYDLAAQARALTRRYLELAIEIALLTERAYNAETERGLHLIRFDYTDAGVGELLGADRLLADIDAFTADYVTTVKSKKLPVKKVISIADAYPMAFQQLRASGRCTFPTEFATFDREHPGMYLCKLRNVELALVGITSATTVAGTLRNVGVSKFRLADGSIVARSYPADVMPISQYSARGDALLFRFNPNDLRAFELNGIDTLWQLDLPPGANRFDLADLLDLQLVIYYDGYFSPSLEASVKAALPTSGASIRTFSLAMTMPDELFFLKSNGSAEIAFTDAMFPANERNRVRTDVKLRLAGEPATVRGLTLRLASDEHGPPLTLTTDATGLIADLSPLHGEPVLDRWQIQIDEDTELDGLRDLMVLIEYTFDYR